MTTLDLKDAFFHVINDHRWLAASGCSWNLAGPNAANETKAEADRLLPNIEVMIQDSLLLHARSLIDFYTNNQKRKEDICLSDFKVPINQTLCGKLETYKKPIEVHLLHLTDWRDSDYRRGRQTGAGANKARPDWNHETTSIVELVFEALEDVSKQNGAWQQPFCTLYAASTKRYRNKSYDWPRDLCEKPNVDQYLKNLGL